MYLIMLVRNLSWHISGEKPYKLYLFYFLFFYKTVYGWIKINEFTYGWLNNIITEVVGYLCRYSRLKVVITRRIFLFLNMSTTGHRPNSLFAGVSKIHLQKRIWSLLNLFLNCHIKRLKSIFSFRNATNSFYC